MSEIPAAECCPRFDPAPWDGKELTWDKKWFLQDHVVSCFHIPLNFGTVMKRCMATIASSGAASDERIVLSDESSLWGADVYVALAQDIPGARTTALSGTFLAKVFEGPYRNMGQWIAEMKTFVKRRGKETRKLYFYYTTCPKCARKLGKNYVVILAQILT